MPSLKTALKSQPISDTRSKPGTPELKSHPVQEWEFKIRGRGTSGWMSYVKEAGEWVQLRASDTSFISAVSAIEPEVMRLAFPHRTTGKKAI